MTRQSICFGATFVFFLAYIAIIIRHVGWRSQGIITGYGLPIGFDRRLHPSQTKRRGTGRLYSGARDRGRL